MSGFVVDNSIVMAWCFEDGASTHARSALEALRHVGACAPALWPTEMLNALLSAERRQRISPAQAARFLELVAKLPIQIVDEAWPWTAPRVLGHGRGFGLSSHDATYLELAERQGLPLATADPQLVRAATGLGVPIGGTT